MDKLKFKVDQEVIYKGNKEIILGLDENSDEGDIMNYLVSDNTASCGVGSTRIYLTKVSQKLTDDTLCNWAYGSELKSVDEERQEILDKVNEVYVRRFPSGAVRSDDRGREKPSFVSPYAIKFCAEHFSANAAFFNDADSAKNYFKGIKPIDIEDSLMRHVIEFQMNMMPQKRDRDKIKQSLVEIMANCVMGLHQIGLEEDGLYEEPFEKLEYIKKEA